MTKVVQQMEIISYKNNTILIFDLIGNNNENYWFIKINFINKKNIVLLQERLFIFK